MLRVIHTIAILLTLLWLPNSHIDSNGIAIATGALISMLIANAVSALLDRSRSRSRPAPRPQPQPQRIITVISPQRPPVIDARPAQLQPHPPPLIIDGSPIQRPAPRALPAPLTVVSDSDAGDARIWRTTHDVPAGWLDEY